jgi:hypothetical protein
MPGAPYESINQAAWLNARASRTAISQLPIQAPFADRRLVQPLVTQQDGDQPAANPGAFC